MWRNATGAFLVTGLLVLTGARASEPGATPALEAPPDLVSPYKSYDLKLRPFYPAPNRNAGVLLSVRINGGRPLRLVLDSGAEFIVIGEKTARSVGLSAELEMNLVGLGNRRARFGRGETVEIGPVSFRNCRVAVVDGTVVEGADGAIPLRLFSDFLLRLDLPEKTLGLIPYPVERGPADTSARGVINHRMLFVETDLNGKYNGHVILDTGAYCSVISLKVARTLSGSHFVPEVRLAAGTGAATGWRVSSAVHFAIAGENLIPNEVVALDLSNLTRHYGVEVMGVLGFPALSDYILNVDYRNGKVKIEPADSISVRALRRGDKSNQPEQLALR